MAHTEIEPLSPKRLDELQPLWQALFDHHCAIGAAGLPTIERHASWPLRRAHYEQLLASQPWVAIWVARVDGQAVGYALGYEDELASERVSVLETLSLLPQARGCGLGTKLMQQLDQHAGKRGITTGAVDVMGGNSRARELYLRAGFSPHSETWMRSEQSADVQAPARAVFSDGELGVAAASAGLELAFEPGPDDTWVTCDRLVRLTSPDPDASLQRIGAIAETLARSGLWSVIIEISADAAEDQRFALAEAGFKLATERLVRRG